MDSLTEKMIGMNEIEGLQFIPLNEGKIPLVKEWQKKIFKWDLGMGKGVGVVCGVPSGNLEIIDIDQKYSLDGKLWSEYQRMIIDVMGEDFLRRMVIQKTRNGGKHLMYRCSAVEGNKELANRPTTPEEKQNTYEKVYKRETERGKSHAEADKLALKNMNDDKVRVLIETRGIGGYCACEPSAGYEFIHGDFLSISTITPDERNLLFAIAGMLNEVQKDVYIPPKDKTKTKFTGLSPLDDYNERGDVVDLLQTHGWTFVKQKGAKSLLLRPGNADSKTSGNYDHTKRWFSVFSTSTDFKSQTAYLPYAVFAMLECKGDFVEARKRLYDQGFGDRQEEKQKAPSTRVIESRIKLDDDDLSFLAEPKDYDPYLQQVLDGTLPQGLTTGSPELDKWFLLKEGNMVNINGIDNTGKSVSMWWLLLISALYHNWHGIIFASENTLGGFMRKMIQFFWGQPLVGANKMNEQQYNYAKAFIEKHFKLIKAQEELYNYKDILNMVIKTKNKFPHFNHGLIDPYNSLKINLSGFSKLNTHEYHYEALSELKAYGQQKNFGWFINHHAVTAAARQKDAEKKYALPPKKADTEGGQKVANKSDEFITLHRLTQHPTEWNVTDWYIRKVKDTDTGGRPSPEDSPIRFEMYRNGSAFREKNAIGYGVDPIQIWHQKQGTQGYIVFPEYPAIVTPQGDLLSDDLPF